MYSLLNYLPFGRPDFTCEEIAAVTRVMESGWIGMGAEVLAFEKELATYLGVPHVVTLDSCTSALFLSLLVQGIGEGDEVICPSLTWCSTANAALYCGAKVVFADIDPGSLCVTPETVRRALTPRTKAVVPVHFGGLPVNIDALREVLPKGVVIVEDAAHALGSVYDLTRGQMVGSSGNLCCFSFYANKNLSTGEGGAIALFDDALADRLRSLRQHGLPVNAWQRFINSKYLVRSPALEELGYKMNYIDLHAAIGRVQLRRFASMQQRRFELATICAEGLQGLPFEWQNGILSQPHARHLLVIKLDLARLKIGRYEVLDQLRARNVGASVHYAPLHLMPLYQPTSSLPATEMVERALLTLPISACISTDEMVCITNIVREVFLEVMK